MPPAKWRVSQRLTVRLRCRVEERDGVIQNGRDACRPWYRAGTMPASLVQNGRDAFPDTRRWGRTASVGQETICQVMTASPHPRRKCTMRIVAGAVKSIACEKERHDVGQVMLGGARER